MSRVYFEDIGIDDLIRMSDTIAIVKKSQTFITEENIKIGKGLPDFIQTIMHYEIIEILKKNNDIKYNQTAAVYPAESGTELYMHKLYYTKNETKSPIYKNYKSFDKNFNPDTADKCIIFLRNIDDTHFEISAENGFENVKYKNKIIQLINKQNTDE